MSSTVNDKWMTIFTITSGSLSLIGSSLLLCTILRSKKRLSVSYRRIIFGTSVYDVFQSLGLTSSIFLSPEGVSPWAIGNKVTCDIQGFFTTIGAIGVPLYLCSLCIYYFCIIRLNMKKSTFRNVEPFLHGVPIFYSLITGLHALTNQYYNNAGSVCYVAPSPITCEIFPDEECTRGEGASNFRLRFLTYPSMAIFVVVFVIMAVITYSAKKMEKRRLKHSFPRSQRSTWSSASSLENVLEDSHQRRSMKNRWQSIASKIMNVIFCLRSPSEGNGGDANSMPAERFPISHSVVSNQRRRSHKKSGRVAEINKQAFLYVASYVLSYGFVWAQSLHSLATKKPPLTSLRVLSSIFFPLQGLINIFIYCRPHVVSLRKEFPEEYTWFRAFIKVLKSGGDDPLTTQERRLRSSQRSQRISSRTQIHEPEDGSNVSMMAPGLETEPSEKYGMEKGASGTMPMGSENQSTGNSSQDLLEEYFAPGESLDASEWEERVEKNIGIPFGDLNEMAGKTNGIPECSTPNESMPNTCPGSNSQEALSKNSDSTESSNPSISTTDISTATDNKSSNNKREVDGIPKSLEDAVRSAEQMLDDSLEEFKTMADEKDDGDLDSAHDTTERMISLQTGNSSPREASVVDQTADGTTTQPEESVPTEEETTND